MISASSAAGAPAAKRAASVATRTSPTRFLAHSPMRVPGQLAIEVDVHTPVARRLVAATPPRAAAEPQAGCSIEDLRVLVLDQL